MVQYRRDTGGCYFLTLTLQDRTRDLLVRYSAELREALRHTHRHKPYSLLAIVVLPDHLHVLMALPEGDADLSVRIQTFRSAFVASLRAQPETAISCNARGEANVWQPRFWEHLIRDEQDFAAHADYIHMNPVKHGLVERVSDWPLSSFHRYVQRGLLSPDWGGGTEQAVSRAGE